MAQEKRTFEDYSTEEQRRRNEKMLPVFRTRYSISELLTDIPDSNSKVEGSNIWRGI